MGSLRARWRAAVVRHLPVALMEYPFESFAAVLGSLGAIAVFSGGMPPEMAQELPATVIAAFGLMLALAGGTLSLGLRRRWRLTLPVGLRLLAVTLGIYAVASVLFLGPVTVPNALIILYIAVLSGARSAYLRAATEVRHRARMAKAGG